MLIFAHGTHIGGENLSEVQPFADVSLEVDPLALSRWVERSISEDEVEKWLIKVTREILCVSEAIRENWGVWLVVNVTISDFSK